MIRQQAIEYAVVLDQPCLAAIKALATGICCAVSQACTFAFLVLACQPARHEWGQRIEITCHVHLPCGIPSLWLSMPSPSLPAYVHPLQMFAPAAEVWPPCPAMTSAACHFMFKAVVDTSILYHVVLAEGMHLPRPGVCHSREIQHVDLQ